MKPFLLFLVLFVTTSSTQDDPDRTKFFPKAEIVVQDLPPKENTWVFILAGQSNMAGRGQVEPLDTIPNPRILTLNKQNQVILAKEPLHFYEPNLTGLDCGLSFGKTLIVRVPKKVAVVLIPAAVGGSSIKQWLGDSTHRSVALLTNFKEKVAVAQKLGQIKGILWHQGESDATTSTIPDYKNRLTQLFRQFREITADKSLPIIVGELGSFSRDNKNWQMINAQIRNYARGDKNCRIVTTADFKPKADSIHFNSAGQRLLGQRLAQEYLKFKKL